MTILDPYGNVIPEPKLRNSVGKPLPYKGERNGKKICAWCGKKQVKKPRIKYCSAKCAGAFYWLSFWPGLRKVIKNRDKVCQICDMHFPTPKQLRENKQEYVDKGFNVERSLWEVDHIVPKCKGGNHWDPGNLRLLCQLCHKKETAKIERKK
jgi:5-methylcytosine-specific restriction endonuclease McrA